MNKLNVMSEDKNHIDFFDLISKYLSGEASDSEVKQLEKWVLSSPENKTQFNGFLPTENILKGELEL